MGIVDGGREGRYRLTRVAVCGRACGHGEGLGCISPGRDGVVWIQHLPDGEEPIDVAVVHPEDWIKGRISQVPHVAAAADGVVDGAVDVLDVVRALDLAAHLEVVMFEGEQVIHAELDVFAVAIQILGYDFVAAGGVGVADHTGTGVGISSILRGLVVCVGFCSHGGLTDGSGRGLPIRIGFPVREGVESVSEERVGDLLRTGRHCDFDFGRLNAGWIAGLAAGWQW